MQTYTDKHVLENTVMVIYIESSDADGRDTYFYVAVRADKMDSFQGALIKGDFDPKEYGQVLTSGYGTPTAELRTQMSVEYGCNHEAAIELKLEA